MALPAAFADKNICILGLGYVGLTLAVAMADTGFRVHGVEMRQSVLDGLAANEPHFWEPRLKDKLIRSRARGAFTFTRDVPAGQDISVFIITVGTPLGADGKAQMRSVEQATRQIAGQMRDGALIILRSTVKLGTARKVVSPILAATGKRFDIAVCPERTLEGRALIELHELPQIVGADSDETRYRCQMLFGHMTPTTVTVSTLESAELVKLVDNTYRDVTFGFANEVAKLCGRMGISAREVIRAGKLGYPRTNVALPGPVGGPCLEKDPHILFEAAQQWGVEMNISKTARLTNEDVPAQSISLISEVMKSMPGFSAKPKVRLLGLAFKGVPATDDLRGTTAKPILEELRRVFPQAEFTGYDPVVPHHEATAFFGFGMHATLKEAFTGADIVLIANNHREFQGFDLGAMAEHMTRPGIIYDYWNMHDDTEMALPQGVRYLALGGELV